MQLAHVITTVRHLFSGARKARPARSESPTDLPNRASAPSGTGFEPDFISDIFPALLVRDSQSADSAHPPPEGEHASLST